MGKIGLSKKSEEFSLSYVNFEKKVSENYEVADIKTERLVSLVKQKIFSIDGTLSSLFQGDNELYWDLQFQEGILHSSRFPSLLPYLFKSKSIFKKLYDFQREGVKFLLNQDGCILADDMGLGKTVQTIAALLETFFTYEIENAWIFCPNTLTRNWERELSNWAPLIKKTVLSENSKFLSQYNVVIVPYSVLPRLNKIVNLETLKVGVVIADESHKLRNSSSKFHSTFKKIRREKTWFLSGTPLERDVKDIRNTLSLLLVSNSALSIKVLNNVMLKALLRQVSLRRLKSDELKDIPAAIKKEEWLEMGAAEKDSYKSLLKKMSRAPAKEKIGFLVPIRMHLSGANDVNSVKQQRCIEIIIDAVNNNHKSLIFSNFNEVLNTQMGLLKSKGIPAFLYSGQISLEEREENIKNFKNIEGPAVMLLNAKSGSEGLTFTEATVEVFIDEWWNPSNNEQAEDRAVRIGQTEVVTIYKLRVSDSIDENLSEILSKKKVMRKDFVEDLLLKEINYE